MGHSSQSSASGQGVRWTERLGPGTFQSPAEPVGLWAPAAQGFRPAWPHQTARPAYRTPTALSGVMGRRYSGKRLGQDDPVPHWTHRVLRTHQQGPRAQVPLDPLPSGCLACSRRSLHQERHFALVARR